MKIGSVSSFNTNFGHISKHAVDAVRSHAEGYRVSSKTGEGYYSANPKYKLMTSDELTRLKDLAYRASMLDFSWIDYDPGKGLVVDFYKDCNPWQACRFDKQKEGNINSALDVLENAVNIAEAGEYAEIDENKTLDFIWQANIKNVNYTPERFRNADSNKILKGIYDKTFDVQI